MRIDVTNWRRPLFGHSAVLWVQTDVSEEYAASALWTERNAAELTLM